MHTNPGKPCPNSANRPLACDHPGCAADPTREHVAWVRPGVVVLYLYCPEHAPTDSGPAGGEPDEDLDE